jgi:hypothetical protein
MGKAEFVAAFVTAPRSHPELEGNDIARSMFLDHDAGAVG